MIPYEIVTVVIFVLVVVIAKQVTSKTKVNAKVMGAEVAIRKSVENSLMMAQKSERQSKELISMLNQRVTRLLSATSKMKITFRNN